jgi:hypothetical protein
VRLRRDSAFSASSSSSSVARSIEACCGDGYYNDGGCGGLLCLFWSINLCAHVFCGTRNDRKWCLFAARLFI